MIDDKTLFVHLLVIGVFCNIQAELAVTDFFVRIDTYANGDVED
jgi:hypothetical protein